MGPVQLPPGGDWPIGPPIPVALPRTSSLATAALVCGILSFFCGGCILGAVAIFLGHSGLREIRDSGGHVAGDGLAKAGLILGWINVGLTMLGVCGFTLFYIFVFAVAVATGGLGP